MRISRSEYGKRWDEYLKAHPNTARSSMSAFITRTNELARAFNKELAAQGIEIDPKSLGAAEYKARLDKFLDVKGCHGLGAIERRQTLIKEFDEQLAKDGFYIE
jgi:hypothetical protein